MLLVLERLKRLKELIKKKLSELEEGKCTVKQMKELSNLLEERIKLLDMINYLENKKEIEEFWIHLKKLAQLFRRLSQPEQKEMIEYLFKKLLDVERIYPALFELIKDKREMIRKTDSDGDIIFSFYWYVLFMEVISEVEDLNILKELIYKAEVSKNLNLKRTVLFCFKNTIKISWDEKKELFWNWKQNPVLTFWKSEEVLWFVIAPLYISLNNVATDEKLLYKNKERYIFIAVVDSYLLLKNIPELTEDIKNKKEETVFYHCNEYVNKSNEKVYYNFWKDEKERSELIQLVSLLIETSCWSTHISGLFEVKNRSNRKKNEELWALTWLIYSVPELLPEKIKELIPGESPDFIIVTHDGKRIAIELTAYDLPKEIKEEKEGTLSKVRTFDPIQLFEKTFEILEKRIIKKADKKYDADENWLFLHPKSSEALTRSFHVNHSKNLLPEIREEEKRRLNQIKTKYGDRLQRIWVLWVSDDGNAELRELLTNRKYSTQDAFNITINWVWDKYSSIEKIFCEEVEL